MGYFSSFPLVRLNDGSLGINITARNKILSTYKDNKSAFYEHSIVDGETPEIIADKFYDDIELAWIILIFNDIHNIYKEWPVDQETLQQYIDDKYDNPFGVHHYVSIATGNIVGEDHVSYDRMPVTNSDYEIEENDLKRPVKLVLPELVGQIVAQHKELMSRNFF